jgi:hypothetical protein
VARRRDLCPYKMPAFLSRLELQSGLWSFPPRSSKRFGRRPSFGKPIGAKAASRLSHWVAVR